MSQTGLDFLDLRVLLPVLWRSKARVLLATFGFSILFFALSFFVTPTYRVTTVLADSFDQTGNQAVLSAVGQLGSLASLAGIPITNEVRLSDEALAVLTSDDFLYDFIVAHDVMPLLFDEQWNAEAKKWLGEPHKQPTAGRAIRALRGRIVTDRDRRTSLVNLSVEWNEPAVAALWSELLVNDLNAEMKRRAQLKARDYIEYLRKQLNADANLEIREAIIRLLEAQLRQEMLATVTTDYAFRVVSRGRKPEVDDYVSPRRGLMAALGLMFGFGVGLAWAALRLDKQRESTGT
jgi:uncharacterized protein involved in exopolysaccharide biosynthesis